MSVKVYVPGDGGPKELLIPGGTKIRQPQNINQELLIIEGAGGATVAVVQMKNVLGVVAD